MEKKESQGFVELEWVCPNCDGRNKGSKKTCQSCGAPQPDNVKFQRAADEKIITDEKVAAVAKAGADIHCGFCGTRNPGNAVTCSQCGGDLKEGKARESGKVLEAAPAAPKVVVCKTCGAENPGSERLCAKCGAPLPRAVAPQSAPAYRQPQMPAASQAMDTAQPKKTNWLLFGGIGAALLLCCVVGLFLFMFPSKSTQGTVTDTQWQTFVPVQEFQSVNYSRKSGSPPSDAYNVSCQTESQEICEDKTIDKGNGFAEVVRECRTEDTQYCDYTRDEWKTIQTYTLSGNDTFPVYDDPSIYSGQRLGDQTEELTVYFSTSNGQETYSPSSVSEFQQFEVGSTWTLKMNVMGGVLSVQR
jgi:ribosomal protein L40E